MLHWHALVERFSELGYIPFMLQTATGPKSNMTRIVEAIVIAVTCTGGSGYVTQAILQAKMEEQIKSIDKLMELKYANMDFRAAKLEALAAQNSRDIHSLAIEQAKKGK